jgi:hypothetical protein
VNAVNAKNIIILGLAATMLASCGLVGGKMRAQKGMLFDGQQFRTKTETRGDDRRDFQVSVFKVSQSVTGALQAADYDATRYCIKNFGNSEKTWLDGGPDAEGAELRAVDDTLTFQGRCERW